MASQYILNILLFRSVLFWPRQSHIERVNDLVVVKARHLVPVDEVRVLLPAAEVERCRTQLQFCIVLLGLFTLLHESNVRNDPSAWPHHDEWRRVVRRLDKVRSINECL